MNKLELQKTANEIRKGIVSGVHSAKAGHPGGSLSAADIFTYLYFEEMNMDPKIRKIRTAIVLYFRKATQRRDSTQHWLKRGYFPRRSADPSSPWLLSAGTSGYETYPGC